MWRQAFPSWLGFLLEEPGSTLQLERSPAEGLIVFMAVELETSDG